MDSAFSVDKLHSCPFFSSQVMAGLDVAFLNSNPSLLKYTVLSRILLSTELGIYTMVLCRKYWAFSQHCFSVLTYLSISLSLTFLAVVTFASNFLKWFSMFFIFADRSNIWESRILVIIFWNFIVFWNFSTGPIRHR